MNKSFLISVVVLGLSALSAEAKNDVEAKMQDFFLDINAFNEMYPQEKVYLHFDNSAYYLEETIWFKAYVVQANNRQRTALSKVLYVELLAPEGGLLDSRKLPIVNGQCHGEFHLDSAYLSGYYEVRAYTRYMLNFGEDAVFSRVFPVYNVAKDGNYKMKQLRSRNMAMRGKEGYELAYPDYTKAEQKLNLQFYPEGGAMVEGLTQTVAFSITNEEGKEVHVPGFLCDDNQQIEALIPVSRGCGAFVVKPDGRRMKVKISYQGKEYSFPLPKAEKEGCVLTVNALKENSIDIQLQCKLGKNFQDSLLAVALSNNGNIHHFYLESTSAGRASRSIAKSELPEGVNTVSVFNREGKVLAERLFFVRHEKRPGIEAKVSTDSLLPFQPIRIDFHRSDSLPLTETFSVAIRDAASEDLSFNSDNIYTNLLLSSELKGYIPDVSYFFEKDDRLHRLHLDLLMLTRGWKRYHWQNSDPKFDYPIEKNLMLDRTLYRGRDRNFLKDTEIEYSFCIDSIEYYNSTTTDKEGRYQIFLNDFYGERILTLFVKNRKPEDSYELYKNAYSFQIDRYFSPKDKIYSYYETNISLPDYSKETLGLDYHDDESLKMYNLPEVGVDKKKRRTRVHYDYSVKHYDVDEELEYMNDVYKISISEHFQIKYCAGLAYSLLERYHFPGNNYHLCFITEGYTDEEISRSRPVVRATDGGPGRYSDSIPYLKEVVILTDKDLVEKFILQEKNVKTNVKYWRGSPLSGEIPSIVVCFIPDKEKKESYLYAGRDMNGVRRTKIKGYSYSKEFVSPDYSKLVLDGNAAPPADYRRTLYWNPDVQPDSTGRAFVEFYNNSSATSLVISAETVTQEGLPLVNFQQKTIKQ